MIQELVTVSRSRHSQDVTMLSVFYTTPLHYEFATIDHLLESGSRRCRKTTGGRNSVAVCDWRCLCRTGLKWIASRELFEV